MEKFLKELQSIIKGQVLSDEKSLIQYSSDGSIFAMKPWAIVLPSSKEDIINLVRWLSEKKKSDPKNEKLSITCRGKGTDQTGGPINEGIIIKFPGCLDKILEIGDNFIRVEPGAIWKPVNDALAKKGHFVPCFPASQGFATIGGGVADNCGGQKSVKYGIARDYILSIKMIIADGREIEIKSLNEKELIKKQTQKDLEGEIYRKLPDLLIANYNLIQNSKPDVSKDATGYWLYDVVKDNVIDLNRLICGAQGTLGIITEITLKSIPMPKLTGLLLASFDDLKKAGRAIMKVIDLKPSSFEMVDGFLIRIVQKSDPKAVEHLVDPKIPDIVLLIEFDGDDLDLIKKQVSEAKNHLKDLAFDFDEAYDKEEQDKLWLIRRRAATVAESARGKKKALPFIEDSVVSPKHFAEYVDRLYKIIKKHDVEFAIWGHPGNGNMHLQPFLDVSDEKDREKLFSMAEEVYKMVVKLKGAMSAEHNDGLIRSPFLQIQFSNAMCKIFKEVKNIFDPSDIFNPHKKIDVSLDFAKKHLRTDYGIDI